MKLVLLTLNAPDGAVPPLDPLFPESDVPSEEPPPPQAAKAAIQTQSKTFVLEVNAALITATTIPVTLFWEARGIKGKNLERLGFE